MIYLIFNWNLDPDLEFDGLDHSWAVCVTSLSVSVWTRGVERFPALPSAQRIGVSDEFACTQAGWAPTLWLQGCLLRLAGTVKVLPWKTPFCLTAWQRNQDVHALVVALFIEKVDIMRAYRTSENEYSANILVFLHLIDVTIFTRSMLKTANIRFV